MRCVVQRVSRASVTVEDQVVGKIEKGLLVLLGVEGTDEAPDARYLADKIANLRIFEDQDEKMNLSVQDVHGAILAVSQFTLLGDARHGRRPDFTNAAKPEKALALYKTFIQNLEAIGLSVATGQFQAHMDVELINDGPVTILLDSKKGF